MYFETVGDFIAMGGHGPYVWGAYIITLVVMLLLVFTPLMHHRRLIREGRARVRREQRQQTKQTKQSNFTES